MEEEYINWILNTTRVFAVIRDIGNAVDHGARNSGRGFPESTVKCEMKVSSETVMSLLSKAQRCGLSDIGARTEAVVRALKEMSNLARHGGAAAMRLSTGHRVSLKSKNSS